MERLTSLAFAGILIGGCVGDPANVGETAAETAGSDGGSGATSTGVPTTTGGGSGDGSGGADTGAPPIDCPNPRFSTCAASKRDLVTQTQQALDDLRGRFEGARTLLAAELGVPGETSPQTLSLAFEAAAGSGATVTPTAPPRCEALAGAQGFYAACHGQASAGGFGCEGRCTIEPTQYDTCLQQGRISCAGSQTCLGDCAGVCFGGGGNPGVCEGTCIGSCSGACDCILDPGGLPLCVGHCEGICDGQCQTTRPGPCAANCVGPCHLDVPPTPQECPPENLEGCIDAGPGTCDVDCFGVPTPPPGTDTCCADLIGFAGELSASCQPPALRWSWPAMCVGEVPAELAGVEVAWGELAIVQSRLARFEEAVAPLSAALQTVPAELDPDSCEVELWNADADALAAALTELAAVRADVDALVAAVGGS